MSSIDQSASPSVNTRSSKDLGELGLSDRLPVTPFDSSHLLSPYNQSYIISNSASPSYTPGESLSEYSNYQSDVDDVDPFFGVNFDEGVQRIDSLPITATLGNAAYPSTILRPSSPVQANNQLPGANFAISTYPLSPAHSNIPNTPPPRDSVDEFKNRTTISQHELITRLHNPRFQVASALGPTPENSGSSHTSTDGIEPGSMPLPEYSPRLIVSHWGDGQQSKQVPPSVLSSQDYGAVNGHTFEEEIPTPSQCKDSPSIVQRADDGSWRANEITGQGGLDPESRKAVTDEVPTLKEKEEQQIIKEKNSKVEEWRSQTGSNSDAENEQSAQSYFALNLGDPSYWSSRAMSEHPRDEEDNNIAPLDDSASLHENRLVEGQTYFDFSSTHVNDADKQKLMDHRRHWQDSPSVPHITKHSSQPYSSNEAMKRFNRAADELSITSRAATWGTRRRSEPSLADFEGVSDGSFLKKLSISSKSRDERPRQNSILDQGLHRLASFTRKRSDSKLKRVRSTQNMPGETQASPKSRHYSQDSLVPLLESPGDGKRHATSINSAFAAMAGPLAAVGKAHSRRSSICTATTSTKSPVHLGFKSVIRRARSRSEFSSQDKNGQSGLVSLWRGQGGPPVLAAPPAPVEANAQWREPEFEDHDEENEDEDARADESDPKMEAQEQADLIVANYEGFKAHIRRLNPNMDPKYHWLVSRIARQQEIRYKNLLEVRVKHLQAIDSNSCSAGPHCLALGGSIALTDFKSNPRDQDRAPAALQLVTDFSDGSNPGESALTDETFPQGIPMPPTKTLPAEFECQLCFKAKRFQKPSDWTKHVHEDVQPFTCTYEPCKEVKSFKRKADWVRHENERHRRLESWICQFEDCGHPCFRKDNFVQHLVREHKLPEPKLKTKAAIRSANTAPEPVSLMLEKCHRKTQNLPQDDPCKFCGRSFPTWKKLTVHLAKHLELISLPILRLVEAEAVDANTIISPVEHILTPVAPMSHAKLATHRPFEIHNLSPHVPMASKFPSTDFEQSAYFPTTGSSIGYGSQAPISQDILYSSGNTNLFSKDFEIQHVEQPRGFNDMNPGSMGHFDSITAFGSVGSGFSHPKVDSSLGIGPLDSDFSLSIPNRNYGVPQASGYLVPQTFSTAPPVSDFQTSSVLRVSESGFGFDSINGLMDPNFQQVPMTRAHGSASSYEQSPQNVPQNMPPYFGHHA